LAGAAGCLTALHDCGVVPVIGFESEKPMEVRAMRDKTVLAAEAACPEPRSSRSNNGRCAMPEPTPPTPAQTQAVRLARKTQSLDVLYAVATSLSQPGSLEQLLEGFLDTFIELVDARAASVHLATGDGGTRPIASRGLDPEAVDRERPEFVEIPVKYQDRILGAYHLLLDRPLAAMGEDMPDLLISVGRHLGLAIEKARLESEARRVAILEERNIIGNELHDSLAQSLIGMRLQLKLLGEALERKDLGGAQYEASRLRRAMTQANADLRELLTNYRLKLDDAGLAQSIAGLVERFGRETGIAVFFQNECRALALTPAQEIQVFFIIQEALANIRRHSGARNVRILLNNEDDLYTVLIEDDGLGMADPGADAAGGHAGLAIMRERTERLQGQIVIESEPGEGTRIVLLFTAPPPQGAQAAAAQG
jgi:two-component system nitrate/nitrite sensor histidine kinase NarX